MRYEKVSAEFPAGEYYIGDLSYVMHDEWKEVCDLTIKGNNLINGAFNLSDGRRFFLAMTAYGDGEYQDNLGNTYGVDAGLLGIIATKDISQEDQKNVTDGVVHDFYAPFSVIAESGIFDFGNVCIDTAWEPEDEDDEYFDPDEEY